MYLIGTYLIFQTTHKKFRAILLEADGTGRFNPLSFNGNFTDFKRNEFFRHEMKMDKFVQHSININ